MTNELTMKRSNLVLPVSGYELDREEMCYVEGGGLIGTYSWNNNAGASWLAAKANEWFILAGISSASGILFAVAAGLAAPTIVGGVVLGLISAVSWLVAGVNISLGQSATNALADAKYAQSIKKSYSVYENKFLWFTTGYSVKY